MCAWSAPRTYTAGEIITASILNSAVRDNLRYLKGLDGVPTIESGLTIDNTDGDERLLLPLLSTAECATVLNAEGEVAFDEQTHTPKYYNGSVVKDIGDHGSLGGLTDDDHTQYQKESLLTTAGDMVYASGDSAWERLPIGATPGYRLRVNAGGTAPEWGVTGQTMQFFMPPAGGSGTVGSAVGDHHGVQLSPAGENCFFEFRMPADFTTLTSALISIIPQTTGTFDWTVTTDFCANGEAVTTHSDSATANGQAGTNLTMLELDVSAALTGLAANDIVGMLFTLDVLTTTTGIVITGLDIKYT